MSIFDSRARNLSIGAIVTLFVTAPVLADDTEIYRSQAVLKGTRPNVMFIMDTSGSMDTDVEQSVPAYDPTKTYDGSCSDTYIYFSENSNTVPDCNTANKFLRTSNTCNASVAGLAANGPGSWPAFADARVKAAQYRRRTDGTDTWQWRSLRMDNRSVECQADDGLHGPDAGSNKKWIWNNGAFDKGWDATNRNVWVGIGNNYRFYTANYVNYKNGPGDPVTMTRLQIVRDVAIALASSLNNVNLGLMRYSTDAQGGYVLEPVRNIADNRQDIIDTLNDFDPDDGSGGTPLSETYYEAARYFKGDTWDYGSVSKPEKSNAASLTNGNTYISPIDYACQKNYIVYLTDGAPTVDDDANAKIATMIGKQCAADANPPFQDNGYTPGSGMCMDDLATWLNSTDLNTSDAIPQSQTVQTYMIGFGSSLAASVPYLDMVAKAGGTPGAYTAADVPTLTTALQTIFNNIQDGSATFVTPSITVNAFNRTETDDDLYFSLFTAGKQAHWDGNLKKYRLLNGEIVDAGEKPAVLDGGFFADGITSIWSAEPDGKDIKAGGAANLLPAPDLRKIYTSFVGKNLTALENAVVTSNANLTNERVGTGADTTVCSSSAACQAAVNWARGKDVNDLDTDKDFDEQVRFMGDPLHGRPAVITYGKLANGKGDNVVFVPTNDGFLHAFNAADGTELWSYIPPELLTRLGALSSPTETISRSFGLDGDLRVLRLDVNQNGIVESGDRVWLFFGMRMGGNHYYGLDVTDRAAPKLLFNIGPDQLPGVGQTWSAPTIARVNVTGEKKNDDKERFVLIVGGGYDPTQETQTYAKDARGNRVYIIDASTGKLLWFAGGTETGTVGTPDLVLNTAGKEMNNSIPAGVTVVDTNGDLFADRMYVGDMGGRIWRFDISNGQDASKLVTGGVIAKLGAGSVDSPTAADNRRFYNSPDVALINLRGQRPFYNIAIGSGYRGHPLDETTEERFYAVRDMSPFSMLTQDQYDKELVPVTDSALVDITTDPLNTEVKKTDLGWKLSMVAAGLFKGEKVLSDAITADGIILFTTYEPTKPDLAKPGCYPSSTNRAYALTAFAGKPVLDFFDDKKGIIDNKDLWTDLGQEGIVGEVNIAVLRKEGKAPESVCLAGLRILKKCVDIGSTVRTFWNRTDAK